MAQPPQLPPEQQLAHQLANLMTYLHNQQEMQAGVADNRRQGEARQARQRRQGDIMKSSHGAGKYNVGQNWRDFRNEHEAWRQSHQVDAVDENNVNIMPASMQAKILLSCFQGQAASRVKQLGVDTPAWNLTIQEAGVPENDRFNNYFDRLQREFLPPEESPLAKLEFANRTQQLGEDVSSYLGDKISLYYSAYNLQQRTHNFEFLFNSVVSGLYNNVIRKRMIEEAPQDENTMRVVATRLVAEERKKIQLNCSDSPSLDGLLSVSRTSYTHLDSNQGQQAHTPMDMNQINAMRPATKTDICNRCGKVGHWSKDCRTDWSKLQPAHRQSAGRGGGDRPAGGGGGGRGRGSRHPTAAEKKNNYNKRCHYCRKKGHLQENCLKKKADEASGKKKFTKNRRPGVKQLDDEQDEEEVDDGHFLDGTGEESE